MKSVPFSHERLKSIVSDFPTPFYIYDEKAIRENVRKLKQAFSWNRGYREFFAVKTTPNPSIMNIFREEGCGAECASLVELMLAERCGFSGGDIMFTSNVTTAAEYGLAKNLGAVINLDDTGHIDFLKAHAGIPELVCCRLNPGGEIMCGDQVTVNFENSKFGSTKEQICESIRYLQRLGAKRFGIHAQFGAHKRDPEYFGINARKIFACAADLYKATGMKADFINLAGGAGIPYLPEEPETDIFGISRRIEEAYCETLGAAGLSPVPLYTELGIHMTGPFGYFVSTVLHAKKTYRSFLGLDASTNSFMSPLRYSDYYHITVMGKENAAPDHVYEITGALCEDRDRFARERRLPRTEEGDLLVFHDAGAYTYSHGHNFNGRLRPAELLLTQDGSVRMIRRAETPEDYFATLSF
jgi:diaminopimelate decarboxylase